MCEREHLSLVGNLQGSSCSNLRVLHYFKLHSFFKVVFDGNGEGIATSVEGEVHGVALLENISNSLLVGG